MGGGDSFQDAVKRSQGAKKRRQEAQQVRCVLLCVAQAVEVGRDRATSSPGIVSYDGSTFARCSGKFHSASCRLECKKAEHRKTDDEG